MVNLEFALKLTLTFEAIYGERHRSKLTAMKAGCAYRRALESLTPEDVEPRKLLTGFIRLESPILYTLFAS